MVDEIIQGDALSVLWNLSSDSIDCIVSDPPYQLDSIRERFGKEGSAEAQFGKDGAFKRASKGFMGKEWDVLPSVEILKECLRVMKCGAFSFWLMTPRQDSQADFVMRLKAAGFNVGFTTLYWTYASGFPKAMNIAKAIDKRMGVEPIEVKPADGVGFMRPDNEDWHVTKNQIIMPEATSEEAKKMDGSYAGFQPKPAVEVIIVAMKPIHESTYVGQAMSNGKGVTWLDDCRIPYESKDDMVSAQELHELRMKGLREGIIGKPNDGLSLEVAVSGDTRDGTPRPQNSEGRFPANLLVSDDVLNDGSITTSKGGNSSQINSGSGCYNWNSPDFKRNEPDGIDGGYGDTGSYSRYFSLDAWWQARIKELPEEVRKVFPFFIVEKASKGEKNEGCHTLPTQIKRTQMRSSNGEGDKNFESGFPDYPTKNIHPTVKPIDLMSYLVVLGSRKNDIILDPFCGSGSTCIAARLMGRRYVGIELMPEYVEIAKKRLSHIPKRLDDIIKKEGV